MNLVQVIPLGGASEIGRSCTAIIQDDDMIIVDAGLSFPDEEMYGVDIVIPDFKYIIENKHKLRAIFLTHGHEDHIGALSFLLPHVKCPVYGTEFTLTMVRPKLSEKKCLKTADLHPIKAGEIIHAGSFSIEPVQMTHSIPDNCSYAIRSKHGIILMTSDFKFDFTPIDGKLTNLSRFAEFANEGVLLMLSDSTNVDREGWGPSEKIVSEGLRKAFIEAPGRVLITTFASNIHRMQQAFTVAEETGRKVAIAGRRMEQNISACAKMGYVHFDPETYIGLDEVHHYPPEQIVILTTGSQGEPLSALVQMSKETYSRLKIIEGDTILYCARPIPGNEAAIWRTVNRLFTMGARVIYDSPTPIHVSGHAYKEELKMMINLVKPFYLAPIHGEPRHQYLYREMSLAMGYPEHRIFLMEEGVPLCMDETNAWLGESVPSGEVWLDKSGTSSITEEIMKERMSLANDGVLSITLLLDKKQSKLKGKPKIQSKGFSGNPKILNELATLAEEALEDPKPSSYRNIQEAEQMLLKTLKKHIQSKTKLSPLVLIHLIEV